MKYVTTNISPIVGQYVNFIWNQEGHHKNVWLYSEPIFKQTQITFRHVLTGWTWAIATKATSNFAIFFCIILYISNRQKKSNQAPFLKNVTLCKISNFHLISCSGNLWKFLGVKFSFPQNFRTRKFGEISVFYNVIL